MNNIELRPYLDDLETRLDHDDETVLFDQWSEFANGRFTGDLFSPTRRVPRPAGIEWPHVLVDDALDNLDALVLQQLEGCSALLASGGGGLHAVRSNYGTPILPSLFGAKIHRMTREQDTLPCSYALTRDELAAAIDAGVPDLEHGLGADVFAAGRRFRELFADYPNIRKHVHIYHPDIQSPMDVCEMLRGSEIFEDAYDDPAFLHTMLELVTETYLAFIREWETIVPRREDGVAVHWGMLHRGTVMLRDDSAMNFSASMYSEFIKPYESRVLAEAGGGAVHFCGRGDHYIDEAASQPGLTAFNMSQPEMNDMEKICRATVDRGIQLIGFSGVAARQLLASGRDLHGNVHVW